MASACVNNIGISPENFLDCSPAKFPSYGWMSPRLSFSRDEEASANKLSSNAAAPAGNADAGAPDLEISGNDFGGFQLRLEDPVTMLDADELFADGKLVPLHLYEIRHSMTLASATSDVGSNRNEMSPMDPYLFSPKAPRCSSRWKELLGLKKLYQNAKEEHKTTPSSAARSLKHFLHRKSSSNGSGDPSVNLPLLKESETETASISARLSLSSSSSGHEHDDLPRLSLDSDHKPGTTSRTTHQTTTSNLSRVRVVKNRTADNPTARGRVSRSPMKRTPESAVHSPRMNSSGKIVFHSLERSSSSPGSFNGGPRNKHPGMERSYSANVRVLNVPVGVFGLFSAQKKEGGGGGGNRSNCRNRSDRT